MTVEEHIAELKAENAALREQVRDVPLLRAQVGELPRLHEQIALLAAQVQDLQARLAKDSHNSSKPPSRDGLARKTKSFRRSGKKPGRWIGHRGDTLQLVATPDAVVEHRPARRAGCQAPPLSDEAAVILRERRQVQELPSVRLQVSEYQALHLRCPVCQAATAGRFPAEIPSRVQYGPQMRALAVYLVQQQLVLYGRVRELLGDLLGLNSRWGRLSSG